MFHHFILLTVFKFASHLLKLSELRGLSSTILDKAEALIQESLTATDLQ